jgi:hypothetical protein
VVCSRAAGEKKGASAAYSVASSAQSATDPPPPCAQKGSSNRPYTASTGTSMPSVAGTYTLMFAPTPAGISLRVASSCATTAGSALGRWKNAAARAPGMLR